MPSQSEAVVSLCELKQLRALLLSVVSSFAAQQLVCTLTATLQGALAWSGQLS